MDGSALPFLLQKKWIFLLIALGGVVLLMYPVCAAINTNLPTFHLEIVSIPPGGSIFIDGTFKGTTSGSFVLPAGAHQIRIRNAGYENYEETIYWTPHDKETISMNVVLKPEPTPTPEPTGILTIDSTPSGADIYVDGSYLGEMTPETLRLSPGDHNIRLEKSEYLDYTQDVVIKAGLSHHIQPYLIRKKPSNHGFLTVSSSPEGASVYLNGSYTGLTPLNLSDVTPGPYSIRIVKSGYTTFTTSLTISSGISSQINADLNRSSDFEKNPAVTIRPSNPDNLMLLPPSMDDITIGQTPTHQTPLLVSSVIAGILTAGVLLGKNKRG